MAIVYTKFRFLRRWCARQSELVAPRALHGLKLLPHKADHLFLKVFVLQVFGSGQYIYIYINVALVIDLFIGFCELHRVGEARG